MKQDIKKERPVQPYRIKWVVNPMRQDKRTGPLSPVKRCDYLKYWFEKYENIFRK
ncbi:hypothetical protein [Priestia aryabhattai]|uniref:hypothetical protein n=1 Tax=Priestia aryabhattai TaxID=412384 RepID=UPI003C8709ED